MRNKPKTPKLSQLILFLKLQVTLIIVRYIIKFVKLLPIKMVHYKEMGEMDFQQDERQEIGKVNVIFRSYIIRGPFSAGAVISVTACGP